MDRDQFLKRVRDAAIEGRKYPVELDPAATAEFSYVGGGRGSGRFFTEGMEGSGGRGSTGLGR